jgi:hypothetical protein
MAPHDSLVPNCLIEMTDHRQKSNNTHELIEAISRWESEGGALRAARDWTHSLSPLDGNDAPEQTELKVSLKRRSDRDD